MRNCKTLCFALGMALGTPLSVLSHAQAKTAASDKEWVVVLKDPRPARLQGWQRSDYAGGGHYSRSLELKRSGQRVAKKHGLRVTTEWFIESLNVYCVIAQLNGDQQSTLRKLRADKNVKWVQSSNSFSLLQASQAEQIKPELLNPPELQLPEQINGTGVVVALVDSAVDDVHSELKKNISKNIDFVAEPDKVSDGEAHGTAIAGVIVADRQSELGITGVAHGADLKAYRGCWEIDSHTRNGSPNCNTLSLARALDAVAMSKPDVLNLSLSGPKDRLLDQLVERIVLGGTRVVTAFDPKRAADDRFPSASAGVLIVRADSDASNIDTFSAPGSKVVAYPGGRADFMSGHSIAAAYTTGVLALCAQIETQLEKQICGPMVYEQFQTNKITNLPSLIASLKRELDLAE